MLIYQGLLSLLLPVIKSIRIKCYQKCEVHVNHPSPINVKI